MYDGSTVRVVGDVLVGVISDSLTQRQDVFSKVRSRRHGLRHVQLQRQIARHDRLLPVQRTCVHVIR